MNSSLTLNEGAITTGRVLNDETSRTSPRLVNLSKIDEESDPHRLARFLPNTGASVPLCTLFNQLERGRLVDGVETLELTQIVILTGEGRTGAHTPDRWYPNLIRQR